MNRSENYLTATDLLNVSFTTELIGILARIAPFDRRFLVLPIPRAREHDIVFLDPGTKPHASRNSSESLNTIRTTELYVIAPEVIRDDGEELVVVGHPQRASVAGV